MTQSPADQLVFVLDQEAILDGVRLLGHGDLPSSDVLRLLQAIRLVDDVRLSDAGEALYKLAWVHEHNEVALAALGDAVRVLNPVQVIDQELRGFGAVSEEGALDLLKLHRAAPSGLTVDRLRMTLRWLSKLGVVTYSQKFKTVRARVPPDDAAAIGEDRRLAAMVSPRTPFSNLVRLRRIVRSLSGVIWWADPHFGVRALEDLAEHVNAGAVSAIRILSGDADTVVSFKAVKDFQRFQLEMSNKSVTCHWRSDSATLRDWHDRWLVDDAGAYNMPPVNTLYKGDWSEILPTMTRPPLDAWWSRANDVK